MKNVYSVRQVNSYIKNMFTQDYMLNRIYVKGEVSNCKYHTSGHIYFSLKDESGTIACVMFAGARSGLSFRMQNGQQVVVLGNINVYERDGKYQLYAREILLDGAGLLYERFEALKKELEEMGMFAAQYKQPIPYYPSRIGIVTAPTGAAIQDIIHIARRRNPYVQLILYPAQVQGDGAVPSIIRGIRMLEEKHVDVMIVGRGGGSIEELWAFNEEAVARAIFACSVPIISAVGHETDTTIADYVADLRAPTPSAAAELAVPEYEALFQHLLDRQARMKQLMDWLIETWKRRMEQTALKLRYMHPRQQLNEKRQYVADLEVMLRQLMTDRLKDYRYRTQILIEKMRGLSPLSKLEKGFSFVQNQQKEALKSVQAIQPGDLLSVYMTDGVVLAEAKEIRKETAYDGRKYHTKGSFSGGDV